MPKMYIPDHFYQELEGSGIIYDYTPSPHLSPGQFVQSKPYYETVGAPTRIPKILILNDWRLPHIANIDEKKSERIEGSIKKLLEAGFIIYIPDEIGFRRLTERNIEDIPELLLDKFHLPETLKQHFCDQQPHEAHTVNNSMLHVIDERDIDALLASPYNPQRILDIELFRFINLEVEAFYDYFIHIKPSIAYFTRTYAGPYAFEFRDKLAEAINDVPIREHYTTLEYDDARLDNEGVQISGLQLTQDNLDTLTDVELNYQITGVPDIHFPAMTSLSVASEDIDPEFLKHLISSAPKLREIVFDCYPKLIEILPAIQACSTLERISIRESILDERVSLEAILVALAQLPGFQTLELSNCQALPLGMAITFSHLNKLKITNTPFSSQSLGQLLQSTPALTQLYIQGKPEQRNQGKIDVTEDLPDELPLEGLTTLSITNVMITTDNIMRLIRPRSRLKILSISRCGEIQGLMRHRYRLKYLEECSITDTTFNVADNWNFLYFNKRLEILKLSLCGNITVNVERPPTQLKVIKIFSTTLEPHTFEWLLKDAANLQTLSLTNIGAVETPINTLSAVSQLGTLKLTNTVISADNFYQLLKQAKKLRSLTLDSVTITTGTPGELYLPTLENIIIDRSELQLETLVWLLASAEKCRDLKISRSRSTLNIAKLETAVYLPNLRRLALTSCTACADNVELLLQHTQHLHTLDFADSTINGTLPENLPLQDLKHLEFDEAVLTDSSIKNMFAASQLTELDISGFSTELLCEKGWALGSVESLKLGYRNIPLKVLLAWVNAAPRLERLRIEDLNPVLRSPALYEFVANHPQHRLSQLLEGYPLVVDEDYRKARTARDTNTTSDVETTDTAHGHTTSASRHGIQNVENFAELMQSFDDTGVFQGSCGFFSNSESLEPEHQARYTDASQLEHHSDNPTIQRLAGRVDASTSSEPSAFDVTRCFFAKDGHHPDVRLYRKDIYPTVLTNPRRCPQSDAFLIIPERDLGLAPCTGDRTITRCIEDIFQQLPPTSNTGPAPIAHYYGKHELQLSGTWQPLPSLSAEERITHVHVEPDAELDIQYSETENLYYVRSQDNHSHAVTIDFALEVPKPVLGALPDELMALVQKFQVDYRGEPLGLPDEHLTGQGYLDAILAQETGACRHRAIAFKSQLATQYPDIPCRLVDNGCHMFVEVAYEGHWHALDLGGTAAELTIHNDQQPPLLTTDVTEDGLSRQPVQQLTALLEQLQVMLQVAPHQSIIERAFQLSSEGLSQEPLGALLQSALNEQSKNVRLDVNAGAVEKAMLTVQHMALTTQRPCFRINSPDDVVCAADYVKKEGNVGDIKDGPGGPLHDFLMANQDNAPVILVNYHNFKPEDVVRLNQMIDEGRKADGTDVPINAVIIGIMDTKAPKAYQGADFASRFQKHLSLQGRADWPAVFESDIPVLDESNDAPVLDERTLPIPLFDNPSWENKVIGEWQIFDNDMHTKPGLLVEAILEGATSVILQNPPLDQPSFRAFMDEARLRQGFDYQGDWIAFPEGFDIIYDTRDHLAEALHRISLYAEPLSAETVVLNPETFSRCYGIYTCDNDEKSLTLNDGLLKQHKDNSIHLYLTSALSDTQWAELLTEADTHNVQIELSIAPGVYLPESLGIGELETPETPAYPLFDPDARTHTSIIHSDEPVLTLETYRLAGDDDIVEIDVTDVEHSQLITKLNGKYVKENRQAGRSAFEFTEEDGAVIKALQANKRVILTGTFDQGMRDNLAPLLISRLHEDAPNGELIILPENPEDFYWCPDNLHRQHDITQAELLDAKRALLTDVDEPLSALSDEELDNLTLNALKAQIRYQSVFPASPDKSDPWVGLQHLPPQAVQTGKIDLDDTEAKTEAFFDERFDDVSAMLNAGPFVFLSGLTGVGKTTFVREAWEKAHPELKMGSDVESIKAWANSEAEGIKTLFIDEANLQDTNFMDFAGMFQSPPSILIGTEVFPLDETHKVIFAGNPVSYGDERHLARLFETYGQSLLFKPLPSYVLYEKVFKAKWHDIKQPSLTEGQMKAMASICLEMQQFVNESEEKIIISPRELNSIALFTKNHLAVHQNDNPEDVVRYFAHNITRHALPLRCLSRFDRQFPQPEPLTRLPNPDIESAEFAYTPSRIDLADALGDFLTLRTRRQCPTTEPRTSVSGNVSDPEPQQPTDLSGGLGGLVVEGEPGIGKSKLIKRQLVCNRIHEVKRQRMDDDHTGQSVFYHIPVSWGYEKKRYYLIKAFREGAVVLIDEINASPMMESLMNALLSGYIPDEALTDDEEDERPIHPGFLLIGTQNPTSMAGRRVASDALKRRLLQYNLPPYTQDEMRHILIEGIGVNSLDAEALIQRYETQCELAKRLGVTPPCFRDIERLANNIRQAESHAPSPTGSSDTYAEAPVVSRAPTPTGSSSDAEEPVGQAPTVGRAPGPTSSSSETAEDLVGPGAQPTAETEPRDTSDLEILVELLEKLHSRVSKTYGEDADITDSVNKLYLNLSQSVDAYRVNQITAEALRNSFHELVANEKPTLESHRGVKAYPWMQNFLYALNWVIHKLTFGWSHEFFALNTKSANLVSELDDDLNEMFPGEAAEPE